MNCSLTSPVSSRANRQIGEFDQSGRHLALPVGIFGDARGEPQANEDLFERALQHVHLGGGAHAVNSGQLTTPLAE